MSNRTLPDPKVIGTQNDHDAPSIRRVFFSVLPQPHGELGADEVGLHRLNTQILPRKPRFQDIPSIAWSI